jgi:F-type H+-transporting ATPase subunit b
MVSLDYTILIQMANFILLIFILRKLLYVPILGVMNERKERMEASEGEV